MINSSFHHGDRFRCYHALFNSLSDPALLYATNVRNSCCERRVGSCAMEKTQSRLRLRMNGFLCDQPWTIEYKSVVLVFWIDIKPNNNTNRYLYICSSVVDVLNAKGHRRNKTMNKFMCTDEAVALLR